MPTVVSVAETAVTSAGTSHLITLPASIVSTDEVLILMDIGSTAASLNALTGWTEVLDENLANGLKVLVWDGAGVPSNPTFVSTAATRSASLAYRISGADKSITPQIAGTTATGTSTTPDPPSVTPSAGIKTYLSIAFFGQAGEEADDDTWANTPPTNYTPSPPRQKSCGTAGSSLGGLIAAAEREINTGSAIDPATFSVDVSAAWRAQHVLIHPVGPATAPELQVSGLVIAMSYIEAAGPTAVGKSLDLRWDDAFALGDPIVFRWDVSVPLGDPIALRWDITTPLGDPVGLLWDIRAALGDPLAFRWDIANALGDPIALRWDINAALGDPVTLRWDQFTRVFDTVALLWDLRFALGDPLALLWDVIATAVATQKGYRFRNDDGSETTATWITSQNLDINIGSETRFRLRMLTDFTNDPPPGALTLQYKLASEPDTAWQTVEPV